MAVNEAGEGPAESADRSESSADWSRESFRETVRERRASLTAQEQNFLEALSETGSEQELQTARRALLNTDLFFDPDESASSGSSSWRFSSIRSLGQLNAIIDEPSESSAADEGAMRICCSSGEGSLGVHLGSVRRQKLLMQRRESGCGMWKAHESGLAFSRQASRRSLLSKQKSFTSNRRNLLATNRDEESSSDLLSEKKRDAKALWGEVRARRKSLPSMKTKRTTRHWSIESSEASRDLSYSDCAAEEKKTESSESTEVETPFSSVSSMASEAPFSRLSSMTTDAEGTPPPPILPPRPSEQLMLRRKSSDGSRKSVRFSATEISQQVLEQVREEEIGEPSQEEKRPQPPPPRLLTREASKGDEGFEIDFAENWETPTEDPILPYQEESDQQEGSRRPVLMRDASQNFYKGRGMEVADWETEQTTSQTRPLHRHHSSMESLDFDDDYVRIRSTSFDDTMGFDHVNRLFGRTIKRTLSDDALYRDSDVIEDFDWEEGLDSFDPWQSDELEGKSFRDFRILGTHADDHDSQPHVLSPPLMESLQDYLPFSLRGENFWMKYSLVRDGASIISFLQKARGAKHGILAAETVDGEVFGALTGDSWRKKWNYFGSGESFVWRMRKPRRKKYRSIIDQAQMEGSIEVYDFTGENNCVQLCRDDLIAVGGIGGSPPLERVLRDGSTVKEHEWGFALSFDSDLLQGTTAPCVTYDSPPLSLIHSDGSRFEIVNLELWTLTPCMHEKDAEKLELQKLFVEQHGVLSYS